MPKQTLFLIIGLSAITIILIAVAVFPKNSQQNQSTQTPSTSIVQKQPQPTVLPAFATPASSLFFDRDPIDLSSGIAKTMVILNTNDNPASGVQLVISYDPKAIAITSVKPGPFFPKAQVLFNTNDKKKGQLIYLISLDKSIPNVKGEGAVAELSLQRISTYALQTTLQFMPETLVAASGVSATVLKDKKDATVILKPTTQSSPAASYPPVKIQL